MGWDAPTASYFNWFSDLLTYDDPAVTVVVLKLFGGHILFEVDSQHTLEILFSGATSSEPIVVDVLLNAAEIRKNIRILFPLQTNDDVKLSAGCHQNLNAVQVLAVLLQQSADGGKLLLLLSLLIEVLVAFKGFLGVERQHFNLRLTFYHIQQGIDSCADTGIRQNADVSGFDDKEHQVTHTGGDAIVCDALNAHELPGRLGIVLQNGC